MATRQNVRSIQTAAQVRDFYTRPAVNHNNRLQQIASAFKDFNSELNQYLDKKREKQETLEMEQGRQLYMKRMRHGEQFMADEMAEKAKNGDYNDEGFAELTKFQLEGIRRTRHDIFAAKLPMHLMTWARTATLTDENGNQVPLSLIDDPERVTSAFYQEVSRYGQEKTGGQFDPMLAHSVIQPAVNGALNRFIQEQASARNAQILREQQAVATEALDMLLVPMINDGTLLTDPHSTYEKFNTAVDAVARSCLEGGMTEVETAEFLGKYFEYALRNTRDDDMIAAVFNLAMSHPFLQDAQIKEEMTGAAEQGYYANYRREQRRTEQKQEDMNRAVFDLLIKQSEGEDVSQELEQLRLSSPEAAQAFVGMSELYRKAYDVSRAMSPEEYDQERIAFMSGQKGYRELGAMYERLNDAQRDELMDYVNAYEQRVRQKMADAEKRGKTLTRAQAEKLIDADYKRVVAAFDRFVGDETKIYEALGFDSHINSAEALNFIHQMGYEYFDNWKKNNPELAANPFEVEGALIGIVNQVWKNYGQNMKAYSENRELLREPPQEVRYNSAQTNITSRLNNTKTTEQRERLYNALQTENKAVVQKELSRQGVEKGKLAGEATRLISDFNYFKQESDRRKDTAEEGGNE